MRMKGGAGQRFRAAGVEEGRRIRLERVEESAVDVKHGEGMGV